VPREVCPNDGWAADHDFGYQIGYGVCLNITSAGEVRTKNALFLRRVEKVELIALDGAALNETTTLARKSVADIYDNQRYMVSDIVSAAVHTIRYSHKMLYIKHL
jgi:hypothetical protein